MVGCQVTAEEAMAGEGVVAREEAAVAQAGAAAALQAAQAIADHCNIQSAMSVVSVSVRTSICSIMHAYILCHTPCSHNHTKSVGFLQAIA